MPRRLRPCPGDPRTGERCGHLTEQTRCAKHEAAFRADPERQASRRRHQRTRQRGSPSHRGYGPVYQRARRRLLSDAEYCHWCGQPPTDDDPLTADHVVPLVAGGGLEGNLVPAHLSCNSRRGAQKR